MDKLNYLKVLFDEGQLTCFGETALDTKVNSVFSYDGPAQYVCLNALQATDSLPSKPWHRPDIGRRADCNVASFRSFLLECDSLPIDEQMTIAERIGLPYSVATFSGNKSVHFVISLETPLASIDQYRSVALDIMSIVKQHMPIDLSTKNPSRFTRLGGAFRGDIEQKVLATRGRVANGQLNDWAKKHSYDLFSFLPVRQPRVYKGPANMSPILPLELVHYIVNGAPKGQRNSKAFWVCCELIRKYKGLVPKQELLSFLNAFDLPYNEKCAIVESARAKMKIQFPNEIG